jgi:DNA processing protein
MDLREIVALSLLPLSSGPGRSSPGPNLRARLADVLRGLDPANPPPTGALLRWFASAARDSGAARARVADLQAEAERVLESAHQAGIAPIAFDEDDYPERLKMIADPPLVLWARAAPAFFSSSSFPAVAIVGSRAASPYALEIAEHLGAELAARGVVVVSGLARGVDSAAHRGALRTGRTLAVLGSGPNIIYPSEHAALAQEIAGSGGLVSELPPGTPPRALHFPLRNRLISGLSLAVVVVEASEKSGSLITAACALDQGREVMAVPGNALAGRNRGAHALIRDGAKIVETADDILEELPMVGHSPNCLGSSERLIERGDGSEPADDLILACLAPGDACAVDELSSRTGFDTGAILAQLAALELQGRVRRLGGGRFIRLASPC